MAWKSGAVVVVVAAAVVAKKEAEIESAEKMMIDSELVAPCAAGSFVAAFAVAVAFDVAEFEVAAGPAVAVEPAVAVAAELAALVAVGLAAAVAAGFSALETSGYDKLAEQQ